jgi:hypothetical protein
MTLFEEAKAKMETYGAKRKEAEEARREAESTEYEAIKEFFLDHGITTGYGHCYFDDATIVKTKKAHCYDSIKEGQEGILSIYKTMSEYGRFPHFYKIAFVPLTKQRTVSVRRKYTYLSSCDFDDPKAVVDAESFLEHVLADFEITDKTYSDEE